MDNNSDSSNMEAVPEVNPENVGELMLDNIRAELKEMNSDQKSSILKNLSILAVSVILFISLGLFRNSIDGIVLIVVVVFIHELGHFIGMKLLKYKDVQMFFIPFFGAAVSGTETAPSGTKKVIVSFMGPVPGIFIGFCTGIAYLITRQPILADATRTFLFLNAFNLLPIHPLDGGKIFDILIFSRHPGIEITFKIIAALFLAGVALLLHDFIFGIFAFLVFISLQSTYLMANIAYKIGKELDKDTDFSSRDVPEEFLAMIVGRLKEKIPQNNWKPKLVSIYTNGIWQRLRNRPCSLGVTIGFLCCYFICMFFAFFTTFLFEIAVHVQSQKGQGNIVQSQDPGA